MLRNLVVASALALVLATAALGGGSLSRFQSASCQAAWKVVPLPELPGGAGGASLSAVTALSKSDAWAVGGTNIDFSGEERPLAAHWDGERWIRVAVPGRGYLYDVAGTSANDVWAVGTTTTSTAARSRPLIEHWDGSSWRVVAPATARSTELYAIAAVSRDNVWAAGGTWSRSKQRGVTHIQHWNGRRWQRVASPRNQGELRGLTAISARNIWGVGYSVRERGGTRLGIQRWDGRSWKVVRTRPPGDRSVQSVGLVAVAGSAADDVWAVGYDIDEPLVEHWDGRRWREVPIPYAHRRERVEAGVDESTLFGVAAIAPNDVWAVGFGIEHWDGKRWTEFTEKENLFPNTVVSVFDVAAVSATDIWAVTESEFLHYSCPS